MTVYIICRTEANTNMNFTEIDQPHEQLMCHGIIVCNQAFGICKHVTKSEARRVNLFLRQYTKKSLYMLSDAHVRNTHPIQTMCLLRRSLLLLQFLDIKRCLSSAFLTCYQRIHSQALNATRECRFDVCWQQKCTDIGTHSYCHASLYQYMQHAVAKPCTCYGCDQILTTLLELSSLMHYPFAVSLLQGRTPPHHWWVLSLYKPIPLPSEAQGKIDKFMSNI